MPRITQAAAFVAAHLPALLGYVEADKTATPHKPGPAFTGSSNCQANIERDYARRNGGHWFDKETFRFFRTTITAGFWDVPEAGVTLFVTGERDTCQPGRSRAYTVRAYFWNGADIETIGPFNETSQRVAEQAVPLFVAALKERAAA
ncbi:hypothetical protein BAJUN_01790 [Bajunvirus bajun]|uniref:Uncharacterized protein n=1 Tax=Brevundimonas phage vB_BgoS-Bajun TaxID=2948594 RepID=A0A9E7SS10_9CAUD|nr:hypothetical protein BAJUN_01790 [Brevundimonas phage vB_BgoS-Bajun]